MYSGVLLRRGNGTICAVVQITNAPRIQPTLLALILCNQANFIVFLANSELLLLLKASSLSRQKIALERQ